MNLPNISGLLSIGKAVIMARRPELLFGASVTATVSAVLMAAKGGYDARGKVDEERMSRVASPEPPFDTFLEYKEEFEKEVPELTIKEKASLTWLCYMPAAITTIGAVGSTTGLHIVHVKEKKALAQTALGIIEEVKTSAKEFEKENLGILSDEEKSKILEDRADNTPVGDGSAHVQNSDGEIEELFLVRDPFSGRDIWSNRARIEEAIAEVGNMVNGSDSASLNNFYDQSGYGRLDEAELVGWSGVLPAISWNDANGQPIAGVRDDGRPYRGFRFLPGPKTGYDDAQP